MTATAAPALPVTAGAALQRRRVTPWARAVALLTAGALALRLLDLGRLPLWRDEAFTAVVAQRSWTGMLDAVRHDTSPPLSYLLTHLITPWWSSPAALRLLPALAGTAAVPLAAALARRVSGERAGLLAAALVAVMPAFVLSARDARMYALATTLVMASLLALWRAVERPTRGRLGVYGACTCLALFTHYLTALAIVAGLVAVAVTLRPPWRVLARCAMVAALAAATLLPWLLAVPAQRSHAAEAFWVLPLSWTEALGVLTEFFAGPGVDPGNPHRFALQTFQGVAIGGGAVAGFALLGSLPWLPAAQRRAVTLLGVSGLGAVVLLILVSAWHPLLEARYASVLWGPLAPLLGVGLARLPLWPLRGLALAALGAAAVAVAAATTRTDVPGAVAMLDGRVGPSDLIVVPVPEYLTVLYYADAPVAARAHVVASDVPSFWGTAAYPEGAVIPSVPDTGGTIWVLTYPGTPPPPLPPDYSGGAVRCTFNLCLQDFRR